MLYLSGRRIVPESLIRLRGSIDAYLFIPCPARLGRPVCSVRRFGFCRSAPNVGYQLAARLAVKQKATAKGGYVKFWAQLSRRKKFYRFFLPCQHLSFVRRVILLLMV